MTLEISLKDPDLMHSELFETDWQQTYRESSFVFILDG